MLGITASESSMWWDWTVIGLWNANCTTPTAFKEWLSFCILSTEKNKGVDVRAGDN